MYRTIHILYYLLLLLVISAEAQESIRIINGVSVPSDFPGLSPSILSDKVAPGKLFLANSKNGRYIMIFENDGTPYFYRRLSADGRDFKVQPNGLLSRRYLTDHTGFITLDSSYSVVDSFVCANGYTTDEHDFQITKNGHHLMIAKGMRHVDMSQIVSGGQADAILYDTHIQEFDEHNNLIFQWLCYEHYDILDAVHEVLTAKSIDWVHINSVAEDYDGNLIISSRNLSEVTKINRRTGVIIWRLGGVHNQFEFVDDSIGFSYQHDARPVPGNPNHYTLFDNGNYHNPPFSRAVEYALDTVSMQATKVWEYRADSQRFTGRFGNVQRLPNGNTLINWGQSYLPKVSEVTPQGEVVYEADFEISSTCYRTFRFLWGVQADKPYLVAESFPDEVHLLFNTFGDEHVKKYIVYGAVRGNTLTPIDTTGYPYSRLTQLANGKHYKFRVCSIDSSGMKSPLSNEVQVMAHHLTTGQNYLFNGDFSDSLNHWELAIQDSAKATAGINTQEELALSITRPGTKAQDIRFSQNEVPLLQYSKYRFQFDAYAQQNRLIEAKIERAVSPYDNYGKIGPTYLKTIKQHFSYEFMMENNDDYQARVVFNCGAEPGDVYLDNVSLKEIPSAVIDKPHVLQGFRIFPNYPNPFNAQTRIEYKVTTRCKVHFQFYNILGKLVSETRQSPHHAGTYSIVFDGTRLSSGIYFVRVQVNITGERTFEFNTQKMVLIK